jgi:hypothetical protein
MAQSANRSERAYRESGLVHSPILDICTGAPNADGQPHWTYVQLHLLLSSLQFGSMN